MSLITATDLAKSYGAQDIFKGVSVAIPRGARIALVGPNGCGKTTLLRLLAGIEKPDLGRIQRIRRLRTGYLPQEANHSNSHVTNLAKTVWESCLEAFVELREQEAELSRLEEAMADPRAFEEAAARYGPLQEAFERSAGYIYPIKIRKALNGLGFKPEMFDRPLKLLSGGERTRALLARVLLEDPDLLILDEPTNHMDIQAVEWLEGWLGEWTGAAVMVSHDRYFLDRTVDRVWDLSPLGVEIYRGNYSAYVNQRAERRGNQEKRYEMQQDHIHREQEYIRRNIAGQNTRRAQGRRKLLERLLREGDIPRPKSMRKVSIDFDHVDRSGDRVLETLGLVIGYLDSNKLLFRVPDLVLTRGECVALIGPNGAGKTTFLKTLLGEVKPLSGDVRLGANLQIGYFAQAHEGLIPEHTVIEEILDVNPKMKRSQARTFLARFLFSGDTVEKPIEILSGGERGRVALAKLALEGANYLLLDEPTNHLDLPSQEVLQQSLESYPGTILLVSHDRYLIDALATQVWVISPEARELEVFIGGYEIYLEAKRERSEARKARPSIPPRRKPGPKRVVSRAELMAAEARLDELERELAQIVHQIEVAGEDPEQVRLLGGRYAEVESDIEAQFAVWASLSQDGTLA